MLNNRELAAYAEAAYNAGYAYWYGTHDHACTEDLLQRKRRQYASHYTDSRMSGYRRDIAALRRCADCVGLIKAFFWTGGVLGGAQKYKSNNCPDTSANGMIALCPETGGISSMPDVPGLVVWKNGHIGVYVGGGYVVEMRGFAYDCQRRKTSAGGWTRWGKLPGDMLDYIDGDGNITSGGAETGALGARTLRKGMTGADVKQLQEALIRLGYDCGKWGADGDFGNATEEAVRDFQRASGLTVDGIFGPKSLAALEAALDMPVDEPRRVVIAGGDCYIRDAANTSGKAVGVAKNGSTYEYGGATAENGWRCIVYNGAKRWVSGKYSKLEGSE